MDIDHKIISVVIVPLLLILEGQLSVTGESMCTNTAERTKPAHKDCVLVN